MEKLHQYQIFFLLGGLLASPLYAANYYDHTESCYSSSEKMQPVRSESFYVHGDLTFFNQEKDKVNQEELKQGLIELSFRIKAKGKRKVYFFIGSTGAGKSFTILALQGNKIKKIEKSSSKSSESEEESDEALCENLNSQQNLISKSKFDIQYVLPQKEVPTVGHSAAGETSSTLIYYPDPKQEKGAAIAFADTEGFLGKRKATSAGKCLSAISFPYALKVNSVGGLVFVISASELDASKGKELRNIAHILQQYFAKGVSNKTIKQSILVMITKVTRKDERAGVFQKLRQFIQLFYQEYYAELEDKSLLNLGQVKGATKKGQNMMSQVGMSEASAKKLAEKIKKQEDNRRLKLFFTLLLEQDVPKAKINDISNFKLDSKRFCFIFPWKDNSVKKILHKKLGSLRPVASDDICTFDNPVSQYVQSNIRYLSMQLSESINELLALNWHIDTIQKQIEGMTNKQAMDEAINALAKNINGWVGCQNLLQSDNKLEVLFEQSHYENLPPDRGWLDRGIERLNGYKLYRAFQYTAQEPVYQIVGTYGPEADLSETRSFWHCLGRTYDQFNFIAKHFNITAQKHNNGTVTWKAVAKNGKGVVKKDGWLLYHVTIGAHKAQCEIKFYARSNERIATVKGMEKIKKHLKQLRQEISDYKTMRYDYETLVKMHQAMKKKLTKKRPAEKISAGKPTVRMLQFFANEILKKGADKALIKMHLKNFNEAIQLFLPGAEKKGNNPKNNPLQEDMNIEASQNQPNDDQVGNNEIFDID